MKVGIDFNGTITAWPNEFRHLAQSLAGSEVYVISACLYKNKRKTEDRIRAAGLPTKQVFVLTYSDYDSIPQLKLPVFQELGLEIIFDDNPAVIATALDHGILGCLIQGQSPRSTL